MLILTLIFTTAFIIRLYQLSFFEYKYDQYFNINQGNAARAAHFLITRGMISGVGLDNPPGFSDVMGVLTSFTSNPAALTFCFFCVNILALILSFIYFYKTLPGPYAYLSAAFLGLFPAFTIYSSNIWQQILLPIIMILFNICLYRLVKYELWWNYFYIGVLAVIATQFHMSGFSLFPLLAVIAMAYWNKIDKRVIGLTLLAIVLLFTPFLIHLFKDKALNSFIVYSSSVKRPFPWEILLVHLQMASYDFFRYYFRNSFNATLTGIAGVWRFVLYPFTFIPSLFFIYGLGSYVGWLIKGRKIFDSTGGNSNEYPLPFQISGLMVLGVTLEYFIFRVQTPMPMHYFIVLFPAYSVLTGFSAFKLWQFSWGRIIVLSGILSTGILLICTLLFIDKAGGHPDEYGISYKTLISWKKEIQAMKSPGECVDLGINYMDGGKFDLAPTASVLNNFNTCSRGDKIIPVQIYISWNEKKMRYEHVLLRN